MDFETKDGHVALDFPDGADIWMVPAVNPFGHGCCDCGLYHQVEFCLVDAQGKPVSMPEGVSLALRFERDVGETVRLREHRKR